MNKINGEITVTLSVEDAEKINSLIDKDTEALTSEKEGWYYCPRCEKLIGTNITRYCNNCGQRLNQTDIAL